MELSVPKTRYLHFKKMEYMWIVTGTDTEFLFKTRLGDLKCLVTGQAGKSNQ